MTLTQLFQQFRARRREKKMQKWYENHIQIAQQRCAEFSTMFPKSVASIVLHATREHFNEPTFEPKK